MNHQHQYAISVLVAGLNSEPLESCNVRIVDSDGAVTFLKWGAKGYHVDELEHGSYTLQAGCTEFNEHTEQIKYSGSKVLVGVQLTTSQEGTTYIYGTELEYAVINDKILIHTKLEDFDDLLTLGVFLGDRELSTEAYVDKIKTSDNLSDYQYILHTQSTYEENGEDINVIRDQNDEELTRLRTHTLVPNAGPVYKIEGTLQILSTFV
jgi:hypothetical protein